MPLLVTLNPPSEPASEVVLKRMTYHHPVFDAAAIAAQKLIRHIQGQDRLWFCGSYCGHGFHEDALRSALTVARGLGVEAPWLERQVHPIDAYLGHAAQALTP